MVPKAVAVAFFLLAAVETTNGLSTSSPTRRDALGWIAGGVSAAFIAQQQPALAVEGGVDVDSFLQSGMVSMPMGVSGQAGKSKPETGVVLRDGSELSRDSRTGDVLAEIVVNSPEGKAAVLASFSSPWSLAKGSVFDVECRDSSTGDGAFLSVTGDVGGKSIDDMANKFVLDSLLAPTGRFSFYGQPTDVKVISSKVEGGYKIMDLSFSTISQATQSEIPRKARLAVTIPSGTSQAVMLVASASAIRWKKGSDKTIASVVDTFRAIPAPSGLKARGKERKSDL